MPARLPEAWRGLSKRTYLGRRPSSLPDVPAPDDVVDSPARVAFDELSALFGNAEGIQVQAVALTRAGRSRRTGAQLDLELTVAVLATGEHALEGIERVLSLAEQRAWSCGQLPDRIADRHPQSLGLTVTCLLYTSRCV